MPTDSVKSTLGTLIDVPAKMNNCVNILKLHIYGFCHLIQLLMLWYQYLQRRETRFRILTVLFNQPKDMSCLAS